MIIMGRVFYIVLLIINTIALILCDIKIKNLEERLKKCKKASINSLKMLREEINELKGEN